MFLGGRPNSVAARWRRCKGAASEGEVVVRCGGGGASQRTRGHLVPHSFCSVSISGTCRSPTTRPSRLWGRRRRWPRRSRCARTRRRPGASHQRRLAAAVVWTALQLQLPPPERQLEQPPQHLDILHWGASVGLGTDNTGRHQARESPLRPRRIARSHLFMGLPNFLIDWLKPRSNSLQSHKFP